ncbi:NAD(P)H-dependent oxidoreductase [Paraburkholderia sediminicola]|uniref:FMN-dependent NADH-azoreductase n=1 Tax=Paraburkholderia sediminicola TaxID=458836 RepID=UPI0038B79E72
MKILHIDSSPMRTRSTSRALTERIMKLLKHRFPDAQTSHLDLATNALPHLTEDIFLASRAEPGSLTEEQVRERSLTDALIDDLLASDVVVIGVPMYNLSVPTQLKAWIDRIAQPGRTFRYTDRGIVGLVRGVKVILASSRGGLYSHMPALERDFQERYMRAALSMLGIEDIFVVRAEGVNMGQQRYDAALQEADGALDEVMAVL